jgi:hypothetical protein
MRCKTETLFSSIPISSVSHLLFVISPLILLSHPKLLAVCVLIVPIIGWSSQKPTWEGPAEMFRMVTLVKIGVSRWGGRALQDCGVGGSLPRRRRSGAPPCYPRRRRGVADVEEEAKRPEELGQPDHSFRTWSYSIVPSWEHGPL